MAEQNIPQAHAKAPTEETQDQGCFHFITKREDKTDDVVMTDLTAAKNGKEEKHTLMDELRRTHSHSTSSSDEEVEEGGERKKKKKKKGLTEAIKDKLSGDKEKKDDVPMEKCSKEGCAHAETGQPEEKKGFLEKIKDKLPGQHNKGEEEEALQTSPSTDNKEKKGIMDMIKEKLPGALHKNNENEPHNCTGH